MQRSQGPASGSTGRPECCARTDGATPRLPAFISSQRAAIARVPFTKFSSLIHSLGAWAFSPGSPKPTSRTGAPRMRSKSPTTGIEPPFADDHRLALERRRERATGRVVQRAREIRAPRAAAVHRPHRHRHARRSHALDVLAHERRDLLGILIGDKAEADLRHRRRRKHGLRAFSRVAAQQTVDLARRTRPDALQRRCSFLAAEGGRADFLEKLRRRRTAARECAPSRRAAIREPCRRSPGSRRGAARRERWR